jgi:mannose-6-phosphate isomerase
MFVAITNTPRDYAWGSRTALAELLGTVASGEPEAELWLGAHPGSPSRIVDPGTTSGAQNLAQWIDIDRAAALGRWGQLPFLMKVLAAGSPLSLQAHPTAAQAREGFALENAQGIPLDAPNRNYRDESAKPEVIVAVSDQFEALCGFRPREEAAEVLTWLGLEELVPRLDDVRELFAWLMSGGPDVDSLLLRLAARVAEAGDDRDCPGQRAHDVFADAVDTVRILAQAHPGDPGILCALLLHRVTLRRGEALYLSAGNIHAYLAGVGIEVMTASDNVLRGGLTPKHVDLPELLRVLDFTMGPPPWLTPERVAPNVMMYRPGIDEFVLARITGDADIPITGPAIALCLSGSLELTGASSAMHISRGQSAFISPDERSVSVRGRGEIFLATTP